MTGPLDCLIGEEAIKPADALTVGLAVLATLADLCRTAEASVLVASSPVADGMAR